MLHADFGHGLLLLVLLAVLTGVSGCGSLSSASPGVSSPTSPGEPDTGMTIVPRTTTPEPTATLEFAFIQPRDCPGAPASRLIVHERGIVIDDGESLNLREDPGVENAQIMQLESGSLFYVLAGPECDGDYAWYRVRDDRSGEEGWIAEGEIGEYYARPYLPG